MSLMNVGVSVVWITSASGVPLLMIRHKSFIGGPMVDNVRKCVLFVCLYAFVGLIAVVQTRYEDA